MAATSTIEERRLTVLGRLREQRGRLEKALVSIAAEDSNVGSEWSALDECVMSMDANMRAG